MGVEAAGLGYPARSQCPAVVEGVVEEGGQGSLRSGFVMAADAGQVS